MRPQHLVLTALLLTGTASLGWGLWLVTGPHAAGSGGRPPRGDAAQAFLAASPPAGPAEHAEHAAVRPGAGTFTHPAPAATDQADPQALCPDCDIVVITMCSMRRDRIGAYGQIEGLTPNLDALAAQSQRFDNAWSASNFTLAGLTALLTGRFGSSTGVTGWDKGLVADVPTLPEILGFYGYRTGAFTIDAPSGFRPDYGLDRGFQTMQIIPPPRDTPDGRFAGGDIGPGGASARPAATWIAAQDDSGPIFAMFHTRTAHFPFVLEDDTTDPTGVSHALWEAGATGSPGGAGQAMPGTAGGTAQKGVVAMVRDPLQDLTVAKGEAGIEVWKRQYAAAVTRADQDVGVVLQAIQDRGRWDHTIVLVVADHGEALGDHGEILHGDAYWDGVTHIPMLLRVPGLAPQAIPGLVSQVDIAPTLLALIGAVAPAGIDGASMLPLLRGTAPQIRSTTLIEGGVTIQQGSTPRGAVVSPPWVLLRQDRGCGGGAEAPRPAGEPAECLFNLAEDPGETENLVLKHPEVRDQLVARWDAFRASRATQGQTLTLDPSFVDDLHRNGYFLQGEDDPARSQASPAAPAKPPGP